MAKHGEQEVPKSTISCRDQKGITSGIGQMKEVAIEEHFLVLLKKIKVKTSNWKYLLKAIFLIDNHEKLEMFIFNFNKIKIPTYP